MRSSNDTESMDKTARSQDKDIALGPGKAKTKVTKDFVTLGMFIIGQYPMSDVQKSVQRIPAYTQPTPDEIEFKHPKPPVRGILGGAGAYSALGARLFSPPPTSQSVGWIVDKGSDFPSELAKIIDSWDTGVVVRQDYTRLTTRGWNGYVGSGDKRLFEYKTPKKRIAAEDITPDLLMSKSFHLICSPNRCQELVAGITSRRKAAATSQASYTRPLFVWEPVPDLCTPDELLNCTNTLRLIDICSPNHLELAGFMGDSSLDPDNGEVSTERVERACEQLLASMPLQSYALVIRAGAKGCYIARNGGRKRRPHNNKPSQSRKTQGHGGLQPDTDMEALLAGLLQDDDGTVAREEIELDPGLEQWIPAYHRDSSRVIDPTGGGNAFLGGLSVALARGEKLEDAAAWGSVAASFAIEQVGMPSLSLDGDGVESWNGERVENRLQLFRNNFV